MKIPQRLHEPELIDLGQYTPEEYQECFYQLDRIGRFLGGDHATYWGFKQLKQPPQSILDVGCGGGLFTIRLGRRYPKAKVTGIDISQKAIAFANERLQAAQPPVRNVEFLVPPTIELAYPSESFDVITSTLVCHHLSDEELITFLKNSYQIARKAIIINDLQRSSLALASFKLIAPMFFPNRLIIHDGALSIQRAFKKQDWLYYLQEARIPLHRCTLTWHWAFRWILFIRTTPNLDE